MTYKTNQDNEKNWMTVDAMTEEDENRLRMNSAYITRIANGFGVKFVNSKSKMFAYGRVCSKVCKSTIDGEDYYKFMLECERKSKNTDIIMVAIKASDENKGIRLLSIGTEMTIIGTMRSRDWNDEAKKHHLEHFCEVIHYEFSTSMVDKSFDSNIVILTGYICTDPKIKVTTKNRRTITEYRLAVENQNHETEYFPILAWGGKAVDIKKYNRCGDKFVVVGRFQSRVYTKKSTGNDYIAYEISSTYTVDLNKRKQNALKGASNAQKGAKQNA